MANQRRALILCGGGVNSVSTLATLRSHIQNYDRCYDVVAGTSAGAINALLYSIHCCDVDQVIELWKKLDPRHIYKRNWFSLKSWATLDPFKDWLKSKVLNIMPMIPLYIGVTNFTDNDEEEIYLHRPCDDLAVSQIIASASYPIIFPHIEIDGKDYCDGGMKSYFPYGFLVNEGVKRVTLILPPQESNTDKIEFRSILSVHKRIISSFINNASSKDLTLFMYFCKQHEIQYEILIPSESKSYYFLDFKSEIIEDLLRIGSSYRIING